MTDSLFIEKEIIRYGNELYESECPQCKRRIMMYLCKSTCEEEVACHLCGYLYLRKLVIDQERTSLDPQDRSFVELDEKGRLLYDTQKKKGFGVLKISRKEKGKYHRFHEPITKEDIDEFRTNISLPDVDLNASYLTIWNDEENRVELVVGYCPDLLHELLIDLQNQQDSVKKLVVSRTLCKWRN